MSPNRYRLLLLLVCVAAHLLTSKAFGQVVFQSSEINLQTHAEASDSDFSDTDGDAADGMNVSTFMDTITAAAASPSGNSSVSDAAATLDFASNLIQANGRTSAVAIGSDMTPANSFGDVGLQLSFSVATQVNYMADLVVSNDVADGGTDSRASVRLIDSTGANIFFHETMPGGPVIPRMMGSLMPDTYTLQTESNSSVTAGDAGGGSTSAEFDVTLSFKPPSMFEFVCEDLAFCVGQFVPIPSSMHGIAPGPADEPIPFWVEGLGLTIIPDQPFDFDDGPGIADLAIITAPFDGPEDMYPDNYELGTVARTILAFKPGSLTDVKRLEELPPSVIIGQAQLLDPDGKILATSRMHPVPEPGSWVLMISLLSGACWMRKSLAR